jgi:alginate O-acetyltransferase complex protein AlgI
MLFFDPRFLAFFAVVFALYWSLPWARVRVWLLLIASFVFYASWDWRLALLICATTAADYVIALGLDSWTNERRRKWLLGGSLVMNLGLLGYFKYTNFFLQSLEQGLQASGMETSLPVLRIIIPVGISFYTFEAINYTTDVYRRRIRAERNFAHFMLFILFFPHLIAGPIVRARDFLPQIARPKRWDWARLALGVAYFIVGYLKKRAVADRMALYCDPVFQNPEQYHTSALWLATVAFALRIYCDFSGYTDMALGTAHMLGYKLAPNFNMPYMATSFSDFWKRWHISLSGWLRDYLFIPLGGSRAGEWKTCRNLLVTMTLGGLWHGVSWVFALWGLLHGTFLILNHALRSFCQSRPRLDALLRSSPGTGLRIGVTFLGVCIGWVLFYTASFEAETTTARVNKIVAGQILTEKDHYNALSATGIILGKMFVPSEGRGMEMHNRGIWYSVVALVFCQVLLMRGFWKRLWLRGPESVVGFGLAAMLTLAMVLGPDGGKSFIYFQF